MEVDEKTKKLRVEYMEYLTTIISNAIMQFAKMGLWGNLYKVMEDATHHMHLAVTQNMKDHEQITPDHQKIMDHAVLVRKSIKMDYDDLARAFQLLEMEKKSDAGEGLFIP